ncbi:hypothetical protein FRC01_005934, partial [Tulasnella sp. 417]
MPKAYAIRRQDPTRLSQKTALYLQRLQDIKEEHQVLDLIEPQYQYPVTPKVHTPVIYLNKYNKPYDFKKKATRATQHTRIDITHCPPATLAYLVDNFPESDISFSRTNLLVPYIPTNEALTRAYQVLPTDTTAEYKSSPMGSHQNSPTLPPTGLPPVLQTGFQSLNLGAPSTTTQGATIDQNMLAAIIAAVQMANNQSQVNRSSKVKIKEPEPYDGKGRGGEADRFILACENYFKARSSDFPSDETRVQFAISYLTSTAQAWGDVILRDLLGTPALIASTNWKRFKKEFLAA